MEYPYEDQWVPGVQIVQQQRPARNKYRMGSEQVRPHGYWQGETLLIPGGAGMQRASSMSGQRPQNIIINNEMDQNQDARSRSRDRSRHRSRSRRRYDDESESEDSDWDEREHERRRHRRHTNAERSPSPYYDYKMKEKLKQLDDLEREKEREKHDYKMKEKLKKLDDLEREKEREKQEEEIKQEMLVKKAKADLAELERKKKEEEIRKRAIEDYNREQSEKELKAKKEKEKADKEFEAKVKAKFLASGYTEEEAERVLEGKRNKTEVDVYDKRKTTFVKVHRKYLLPETLEAHGLPWEWDDRDGNYIIIKRWVDKDVQDELFEHTRKIKERKLIAYESPEKQKDKLYIVRKKSPSRKSWMFT